ncbi:hypothetical protein RR47_GL002302 [Enterococcus columbae DSM 7374 = ATCC 51263]|nr:hypothetical protein RR47_GL002302 [Enterococcus columbae DSM 7374 = ATCC 51263]
MKGNICLLFILCYHVNEVTCKKYQDTNSFTRLNNQTGYPIFVSF